MTKPGEKGKCVNCNKMYIGSLDLHAWCRAKKIRFICGITVEEGDQYLKPKVMVAKHKKQLITKLQTRVNPSWCPYRQDEDAQLVSEPKMRSYK